MLNEIKLEYPLSPEPRYIEAHPRLLWLIAANRSLYEERLREFADLDLSGIDWGWDNVWISPMDGVTLMGMVRRLKPATYLEIGSGISTRFARLAVNLYSPTTKIVSIDPTPRIEIDSLCNTTIRQPLENVDLSIFDLQPNDILFLDGSHRCFMNSDVTAFFLDVLPQLRPGVMVQVHDVTLPWDYEREDGKHFYSEQYLLACWLLAGNRLNVEMPNAFVSRDPLLRALLEPTRAQGCSFWFSVQE